MTSPSMSTTARPVDVHALPAITSFAIRHVIQREEWACADISRPVTQCGVKIIRHVRKLDNGT